MSVYDPIVDIIRKVSSTSDCDSPKQMSHKVVELDSALPRSFEITGRNLSIFLTATTPYGRKSVNRLDELWDAFEEASCFGILLPIFSSDSSSTVPTSQVFIPYLSALYTPRGSYVSEEAIWRRVPLSVKGRELEIHLRPGESQTSWFTVLWQPLGGSEEAGLSIAYGLSPVSVLAVLTTQNSLRFKENANTDEMHAFCETQRARLSALYTASGLGRNFQVARGLRL